jgi:2-polyprenyl-3-methyl-5-hydroxy-6-metoxy-1,4-benzoquinol methylase
MPNYSERSPREVKLWMGNEGGSTTASTSLHPRFLSAVPKHSLILDVGCGYGRIPEQLAHQGHTVIGVDPNFNEVSFANKNNTELTASYAQATGSQLPFRNNTFDVVTLLAVLGAVGKNLREEILTDSVRCLAPGGLIYVAEFARITDPQLRTMRGRLWVNKYMQDAELTGEDGSIIVHNSASDNSIRFIGHHFKPAELSQAFTRSGIEIADLETVQTISQISGKPRNNINIWGRKTIATTS